MSVHLDAKSESVLRTEIASPVQVDVPSRRVTLFERSDMMKDVPPVLIAAIQRELVEMRLEYEGKIADCERRLDRRITDLLNLAATERLDMERLRLESRQNWETATGSSARSRSPSPRGK